MRQIWVDVTRSFYTEFPETLERLCLLTCANLGVAEEHVQLLPKVWKTIGDELVFCCTIKSMKHLAACVSSFVRALNEYGAQLETRGHPLDVKGSAWTATFPSDNVIVEVSTEKAAETAEEDELPTEQQELRADEEPFRFDFLGKGIDAGFRLARFATAEQCVVSLELAWLLTESELTNSTSLAFSYHEREVLKGVHDGKPYPIITINAERNAKRRDVRSRERLLTGERVIEALHINDFLSAFMDAEKIDLPYLPSVGPQPSTPPETYRKYAVSWELALAEVRNRYASEQASIPGDTKASKASSRKEIQEARDARNSSLDNLVAREVENRPIRIRLRPIRPITPKG